MIPLGTALLLKQYSTLAQAQAISFTSSDPSKQMWHASKSRPQPMNFGLIWLIEDGLTSGFSTRQEHITLYTRLPLRCQTNNVLNNVYL